MTRSTWRITKDEAIGDHGMVAAKHPLAAEAGLEVLERGGNAVDAAVTMAFVMGVAEPAGSGIGGGGMMILHQAATGENIVVDFAMDTPAAAVPGCYELGDGTGSSRFGWRKVKDDANIAGYRSAAVPGLVRGLTLALEQFGTISLSDALAPAIRCAEDGVEVDWQLALRIAVTMPVLQRFPASAAVFLPSGTPLRPGDSSGPGDRLVQPDLARTLRLIAAEGPDGFYRGPVAQAIATAMLEHGGLIGEDDLASYQATVRRDGQVTTYRDVQIIGVPGACGCVTAQQSLNILEGFDLAANPAASARNVHLHAEAYRRAFADRYRYIGDPKQVAVPWQGLLSKDYAATLRTTIEPDRAAETVAPGDPWAFDEQISAVMAAVAGTPPASGDTSTTHLCAVDRDRNVVTLTQTLANAFGSGVVVPGTGVLLNNAMLWSDPEPGRPNSVAPGKRGLNNMTPLLVHRAGRPFLAVGAPGGVRILNAMSQVIVNVVDHGMGIQEAITAPRIDCSGPEVIADSRFPAAVLAELTTMGHRLQVVEETFYNVHFSTPLAILIDPESGRLHGGVDAFRTAIAAGY